MPFLWGRCCCLLLDANCSDLDPPAAEVDPLAATIAVGGFFFCGVDELTLLGFFFLAFFGLDCFRRRFLYGSYISPES